MIMFVALYDKIRVENAECKLVRPNPGNFCIHAAVVAALMVIKKSVLFAA